MNGSGEGDTSVRGTACHCDDERRDKTGLDHETTATVLHGMPPSTPQWEKMPGAMSGACEGAQGVAGTLSVSRSTVINGCMFFTSFYDDSLPGRVAFQGKGRRNDGILPSVHRFRAGGALRDAAIQDDAYNCDHLVDRYHPVTVHIRPGTARRKRLP